VLPPWYRTIWSYLFYSIALILLGYYLVEINSRRLKNANIRLEEIIKERTSEIALQNEELKKQTEQIRNQTSILQETNASKDKFFSIIAHDLKSPFQGLMGSSQILYEEYDELTDEEKKEFIKGIHRSSRDSFRLLENLLQWSSLQTGRMEFIPETFNVYEQISPTIDLLSQSARNKMILIENEIDKESSVMADINMFQTVVRNLISNAIKFTGTNGRVIVSSKEKNDLIEFSVKDNGIGMNAETASSIFRIDKNTTTLGTANEKGTGLGLFLCKEMIEMHNGRIWVESEPEKGSTFFFTLPKAN
jgi:two-component system, sensor histidine kinase and response regulator